MLYLDAGMSSTRPSRPTFIHSRNPASSAPDSWIRSRIVAACFSFTFSPSPTASVSSSTTWMFSAAQRAYRFAYERAAPTFCVSFTRICAGAGTLIVCGSAWMPRRSVQVTSIMPFSEIDAENETDTPQSLRIGWTIRMMSSRDAYL